MKSPEPGIPASGIAHSSKERAQNPVIREASLQELTAGNSAFAVDLYHALRAGDDNLFFSPYSISLALAMAYAGAHGKTASEMTNTLHFKIPDDSIHSGFNALESPYFIGYSRLFCQGSVILPRWVQPSLKENSRSNQCENES